MKAITLTAATILAGSNVTYGGSNKGTTYTVAESKEYDFDDLDADE